MGANQVTILYVLWHSYQPNPAVDRDEEKFIGIYSTEVKAKAAIQRLQSQPGFIDHPDGFEIHPQQVDETGWDEGFATVWGDEDAQAPMPNDDAKG